MILMCKKCKRMISVSNIPGGNPVAKMMPDVYSAYFSECEACGEIHCDRCTRADKACPSCGGKCIRSWLEMEEIL